MLTKLLGGVHAAIGCRFLPMHNQLLFVEYSGGAISVLDMIAPVQQTVSQGTIILKGTWLFDCESGALVQPSAGTADIWWEQIDNVHRRMTPRGGASIVNLGHVPFASVTAQVLQTLPFGTTPIPGNNDASNQLVNGDVFAVHTTAGNFTKILVLQYGYDMKIQWVTYRLASAYHTIGTGYMTPEDIAVNADEKTAYVTERTGALLKVDLNNANRAAAKVVCAGMTAPQQIHLDEVHNVAYVVEYADPGRLIRIDLSNGQQTTLLGGLHHAVGLVLSPDLAYAYITEQGRVSRYSLPGGARLDLASGLKAPFYLTWSPVSPSTLFVADRDPANRILALQTTPGTVQEVLTNVGARPSSVAFASPDRLLICCDSEIDSADLLAELVPSGLFKGIGLVPWNLITAQGKADTTTEPNYPYQFAKDSPFGGVLSLQINHALAWLGGARHYRVLVELVPRLETWHDLKLNPANGKYEISVPFGPHDIGPNHGYYDIRAPGQWFMNTDLGMVLPSTLLANGLRSFRIEFTDAAGAVLQFHEQAVLIDNQQCIARIGMPTVSGNIASPQCGTLHFTAKTDPLKIEYTASHPALFATYGFWIVRGANVIHTTYGNAALAAFTFTDTVGNLLGTCTAAGFAAELSVWSTVINGYGRQSQYDAYATVAFALIP